MTQPQAVDVPAVVILPPPATPLALPTAQGSFTLVTGRGVLLGWSINNPSSATASGVTVFDGQSVIGQMLAAMTVPPSMSLSSWFGPGGVRFATSLIVRVAAQSVTGAVYYRPLT